MLERGIAVINGKGGVGKSSIAANVGGQVAATGDYRVLLVDLDPQGNLSRDLGVKDTDRDDDGVGLFTAVTTRTPLAPIIDVRAGLDIVCGGSAVDDMGGALDARKRRGQSVDGAVRDVLIPIANEYDLVLVDCPPGDQQLQRMALAAVRYAIIPTKPDAASLDGLVKVAHLFEAVREAENPGLQLLGVALFGVEKGARRVDRNARAAVGRDLGTGDLVFTASIRHSTASAVACRDGGKLAHELEADLPAARRAHFEALRKGRHRDEGERPVVVASAGNLAGDYTDLTREIMARLVTIESRAVTA